MYFQNYFANRSKNSKVLQAIYNICVRVIASNIGTLAFCSSLYIRYNTAAHAVSTSAIPINFF